MRRPEFAPIAFAFVFVLLSSTTALAKDSGPTSVFDLTLGEPFNIRECKYEVLEQQMGMEGIAVAKRNRGLLGKPDHISKMYRYTEAKPSADKCFQRVGPFYTSSPTPGASLPPALPPNNQKVKLVYADSSRPAIADSEDIWIGIQDSKLTGVRFYFQNRNEQNAFQTVSKKYGPPASTEKFTIQTPAGTLKSYYSAKWSFPKLQVTFLSLDTNQIGYDPQDAPLGYLSEVGSVTVQYKVQEAAKADNNPL
ncbi:MAG: hypothetical protein JSS16_08035 [Proteobacteria bacterium]|nr:hypothetical protein [Pseudomonadota bacterium]MBS0566705.1 hypothetical protein [Pseudomonadota bacterium]